MKQLSEKPRRSTGRLLLQVIAVAIVVAGPSACETTPPVQEMSDARQAIAVAKKAGAAEWARMHLSAAEKYLDSAQRSLNERAYHKARRDAKQAKMKALDALRASEGRNDKPGLTDH